MSLPTEQMFSMPKQHSDDTLIPLDADKTAAALDAIRRVFDPLSFLMDEIKRGSVKVSSRYNTVGLAVSHTKRLNKLLGGADDDRSELELACRQLRSANTEAHRLRDEMGKGVTMEAIGNKLRLLSDEVGAWWKSLGFGYSTGQFEPQWNGAQFNVRLSANLDQHAGALADDTPVTGKARKMATLEELGRVADLDAEGSKLRFLDTPRNRRYVVDQLALRFAGATVWEFRSINLGCRSANTFVLRDVEANIPIQSIDEPSK